MARERAIRYFKIQEVLMDLLVELNTILPAFVS